jgi:flagellar basal body-associated protein FliL
MRRILILVAMVAIALGALASGGAMAQEKKKKKSEGQEMTYERKLPANYAPFGPCYVTNYQGGQFFEGRVSIAIEAVNVAARGVVWSNKPLVNGIIQPLAVKLFEQGRPTPSRVEAFKKEAARQLDARFKDKIKGIYVREVMG